jgi:hypothetical protein
MLDGKVDGRLLHWSLSLGAIVMLEKEKEREKNHLSKTPGI